jgi:hypothetical protein
MGSDPIFYFFLLQENRGLTPVFFRQAFYAYFGIIW